jgi:AcrR family transcriptional regulator
VKPVHELSPTQAATRARVIDAAVALATERGYDGFTMRDVAGHADISPATAYLYYGSKDAVLVDALLERGVQSSEAAGRRGGTPRARVLGGFGKVVHAYERAPLLYRAMFRAYVGQAANDVSQAESSWSGRSWLDRAIPDDMPDRAVAVEMLQAQVLAGMIALVTGSAPRDVVERFQRAVDHILASR